MPRPMPKRLQQAIDRRFADRVEEGWTEQDDWNGPGTWSHWIWLKPGWRNAVLDPIEALHAIHEPDVAECIRQLKGAQPCDCDECRREVESPSPKLNAAAA